MKYIVHAFAMFAIIGLSACGPTPVAKEKKMSQAEKAAKAAQSVTFTENAEIENIEKRLNLTSDPAALGYILLLNEMGNPVLYTSVLGKVTSGGKRLTKPFQLTPGDRGEWNGHFVTPAPSDEGTWGSSNPYIYFWTTNGQYIQWSGKYLYSDQPLRVDPNTITVALPEMAAPPASE